MGLHSTGSGGRAIREATGTKSTLVDYRQCPAFRHSSIIITPIVAPIIAIILEIIFAPRQPLGASDQSLGARSPSPTPRAVWLDRGTGRQQTPRQSHGEVARPMSRRDGCDVIPCRAVRAVAGALATTIAPVLRLPLASVAGPVECSKTADPLPA